MADMNETRNANNDAALARIVVSDLLTARFAAFLKGWHKHAGDKPTQAMLNVGAAFSKKQSVCEAGFVAMQLRPQGCSVKQLGIAFDCGPAHNHTRDLVNAGYVKRSAITSPSLERAKYFTLELTKKGEAHLAKVLAAVDNVADVAPVKATKKGKAKAAKKPKAKPVTLTAPDNAMPNADTSIDNAVTVTGLGATPVTVADIAALADKFNG